MKISNLGATNPALAAGTPVEEIAAADQPSSNINTSANKGYSPSPEFQQLINLVKQQPDVREDRVQAATLRLQQGYYHTQASAEGTAAALLNGLN